MSAFAHHRFFSLAACLPVLVCILAEPPRAGAVMTPPSKIASWGFEVPPSGRSDHLPPANQDGIRGCGLCAYEPASGRPEWPSRDPIEENGGVNLYGYASNDPVSQTDLFGLVGFKFDEKRCRLNVTLSMQLNFVDTPGFPTWNIWKRMRWRSAAKRAAEQYFNGLHIKCFPKNPKCCPCPSGVGIKFDLRFVNSGSADVNVDVTNNPSHISSAEIGGSHAEFDIADPYSQHKTVGAYSAYQVPIVHEIGHLLGLKHPGTGANRYTKDFNSLMGGGMAMRLKDFDTAFCGQIPVSGGCKGYDSKFTP